MNLHRIVFLSAALAVALPAHAQSCSGGAEGGMDATGNQCASVSWATSVDGAVTVARPLVAPGFAGTATPRTKPARGAQRPARTTEVDRSTLAAASVRNTAPLAPRAIAAGPVLR